MHKSYAVGGAPLEVLRGIDLEIGPGEQVALIGPSGCGKSTIVTAMAGLTDISGGSLLVGGTPPRAGRRDVGIMLQTAVLLPWRTVLQNTMLPLRIFGVARSEARARAVEVLDLVGLTEFVSAYPWQLSGGMQQRVALARALAYHPQVLLLDEPFSALDEFTRERLNFEYTRICQEQEQPTTTVLVTHSIPEAVTMCDRVIVLKANPGEIVGDVRVDLPQPRTPEVLLSAELGQAIRQVRQIINDNWYRAGQGGDS